MSVFGVKIVEIRQKCINITNYSAWGALNIINHLDIRKEEKVGKTVAFDSSIITIPTDFHIILFCFIAIAKLCINFIVKKRWVGKWVEKENFLIHFFSSLQTKSSIRILKRWINKNGISFFFFERGISSCMHYAKGSL